VALHNNNELISDKQLFLAISKGSHEAFRQFFDMYKKRIYGSLYKILRSHEDVGELMQVVFIKIWENRTTKNPDLSLDAWVFKIAKNCALNMLQQRARKLLFEKQIIDNFELSEDGETPIIDKDLKQYLNDLIADIPERRREIFKLRYEKQLSYKEIAEQLGISENTVHTQISRSLNYLREQLGKELLAVMLPLIIFFEL